MKLVIYTNYYDFCNSFDDVRYVEYSSKEKFMEDFTEWCKNEYKDHMLEYLEGFLGLGLHPIHLHGDEQHASIEIYTYEEWWDKNVVSVKETK